MEMKVRISNVRLAFPNLFRAKAVGGEGEPRFSAVFPIDPKSENVKIIEAAISEVATAQWKAKAKSILDDLISKGRVCYWRGPLTKDGEVYDGFEGMFTCRASNTAQPTLVDRNPKVRLSEKDGRPYSGCRVNAVLEIWAQDNQYGKRINATLAGVQFVDDDEPFVGARAASENDFEILSSGDQGEDDLPEDAKGLF
jgi:hypothetical protein